MHLLLCAETEVSGQVIGLGNQLPLLWRVAAFKSLDVLCDKGGPGTLGVCAPGNTLMVYYGFKTHITGVCITASASL